MNKLTDPFSIELNGVRMTITPFTVHEYAAYRVMFSSKRAPLVVVRSKKENGDPFWTSVPEGRQPEAEGVGALIEQHIKKEA